MDGILQPSTTCARALTLVTRTPDSVCNEVEPLTEVEATGYKRFYFLQNFPFRMVFGPTINDAREVKENLALLIVACQHYGYYATACDIPQRSFHVSTMPRNDIGLLR